VQGDIRTETGGKRADAAGEDKGKVNSRDSMIERTSESHKALFSHRQHDPDEKKSKKEGTEAEVEKEREEETMRQVKTDWRLHTRCRQPFNLKRLRL